MTWPATRFHFLVPPRGTGCCKYSSLLPSFRPFGFVSRTHPPRHLFHPPIVAGPDPAHTAYTASPPPPSSGQHLPVSRRPATHFFTFCKLQTRDISASHTPAPRRSLLFVRLFGWRIRWDLRCSRPLHIDPAHTRKRDSVGSQTASAHISDSRARSQSLHVGTTFNLHQRRAFQRIVVHYLHDSRVTGTTHSLFRDNSSPVSRRLLHVLSAHIWAVTSPFSRLAGSAIAWSHHLHTRCHLTAIAPHCVSEKRVGH